ncbi:MAG TPA: proton-conducting transporter membrane subunit [Longimicrobiales bacterium]
MTWLWAALGVLVAGGVAAAAFGRTARRAAVLGAGACVLASVLGLFALPGPLLRATTSIHSSSWSVPFGSILLVLDPLAAVFLLLTFLLSPVAAWYGASYLRSDERRWPGLPWLFYDLLIAAIVLVLLARNAVLFLVAWEVMTLASFFLVTFEDERAEVRRAGWLYLIATHVGTAFLMVFFAWLAVLAGTFDFAPPPAPDAIAAARGWLFALALVGFGTKAGLVPVHVWLPEAHPAAPSHVSAVMSGAMIATGIYGILRAIELLGPLPGAWGLGLIVIGALTGIVGALYALAQDDLKRLLAYSSVENMGIALLAIGAGTLGVAEGSAAVAALGFGAALLHVLNHALFKGLLFLGAGAVRHAAGVLALDRLGGLAHRMPGTAAAFVLGSAAIVALPPLNGFASEFLAYLAGLRAVTDLPRDTRWGGLLLVASLATTGALAIVAFVKAAGAAFLGRPRSEQAAAAHEVEAGMRRPLYALAAGCVLLGVVPWLGARAVSAATASLAGQPAAPLLAAARTLGVVAPALAALIVAGGLARVWVMRGRRQTRADTWACGYAAPLPRAQYTASSLVAPLTALVPAALQSELRHVAAPEGYFPAGGRVRAEAGDVFAERVYRTTFLRVRQVADRLRLVQHGRVQWYLLYIFAALIVLLLVEFGRGR